MANRGSQWGPVGGMGQRANAQNLDLNRDCTKLETAEARSLAMLLTSYDPQVAMDLHTTDGSPDSGFYLTYETSLNPNDSKATSGLLRDTLLPLVTTNVKAKHGWASSTTAACMRGGPERAWSSDAELAKPRYTSTYFGVRNRLGILTETYWYASFEDRIKATYWFLEEIARLHREERRDGAQGRRRGRERVVIGKELAVRQKLVKAPEPKTIVFAQTVTERNPYVPDRPYAEAGARRGNHRGAAVLRHDRADRDQPRAARVGDPQRADAGGALRLRRAAPAAPPAGPPPGGRAGGPPGGGGQFGGGGGRGGMGGSPDGADDRQRRGPARGARHPVRPHGQGACRSRASGSSSSPTRSRRTSTRARTRCGR